MTTPFTPGPWRFMRAEKPGSNGDFYVYLRDANDRKIVGVWGKRGEKEATAALIAAAPDMYAALTNIARLFEENRGPLDETVEQEIKAVLAKARGEQP